jgi:superfamily II DNA or RNA helicase
MSEREHNQLEAYELTDYLVGPFNDPLSQDPTAGESAEAPLAEWQVPYYQVALSALRAKSPADPVPENWMPDPAQGAELYRELAYERKMHGMIRGLKEYIADYKSGAATTRLRPSQQEVMDDLAAHVVETGTSEQITVKSPTATGKTAILVNLVRGLRYKEQPNDPVRALVLVPSKDILNQTISEFEKFAPEIDLGVYYSEKKDIKNVTTMTYRSFVLAVRRGLITRDNVDVIVNDEEHESGGLVTAGTMEYIAEDPETGKRKLLFGMSATPREKMNLAHEKTLVEALDEGLISPISVKERKTNGMLREVALQRKKTREDYTEEELAALINDDPRNEEIMKEVLSGLSGGRRVAVRCLPGGKMLHPNLLNERLQRLKATIQDPYTGVRSYRHIRSLVIDGAMRSKDRRLILSAYNNHLMDGGDGLDVVLFVDTLFRGWDSPVTKKVIDTCPTLSWKRKEQILGRITRPFTRMDGTPIYGQAVDIMDDSIKDQVLFRDVVNKYAPAGQRYIMNTVIGPGLRDPRHRAGYNQVFEPIPADELEKFQKRQKVRSSWREGEEQVTRRETTEVIQRMRQGTNETVSEILHAIREKKRSVEDTRQASPFDAVETLTPELARDCVSLTEALEELDVDQAGIEDIVIEKNLRLYKDEGGSLYLTRIALRRIRTALEE